MIRAFPWPSSSETFNDWTDASIGKTATASEVSAGSDPVITGARPKLKSSVAICRLLLGTLCEERSFLIFRGARGGIAAENSSGLDRKSTRLNSSHGYISYDVL